MQIRPAMASSATQTRMLQMLRILTAMPHSPLLVCTWHQTHQTRPDVLKRGAHKNFHSSQRLTVHAFT